MCHLYEFAVENFQPEFKVPTNWFVAMGSGQLIADPFFGLLRRTFFRNCQPRLQEGIFAAAWALEHAIELNPGGINRPVQIGVLKKETGFVARMLTDDELEEQKNSVAAVAYLAEYREKLNAKTSPVKPATTASDDRKSDNLTTTFLPFRHFEADPPIFGADGILGAKPGRRAAGGAKNV